MASETCFVIMPIGKQEYSDGTISESELKQRYDDLIKEALLRAHPDLEVVRADEISAPGAITTDIITRIMHSDHVLADITYPNLNVFYELGLRHASRLGTIIIRDKKGPKPPFDIAPLRHFEYENTPTGLKQLAEDLKRYFAHRSSNPDHPDNQFQELAKLTHFSFPNYSEGESTEDLQAEALMAVMQAPELLELFMQSGAGEQVDQREMMRAMAKHPDVAKILIQALTKAGELRSFQTSPSKPIRRNRKKRK